MTRRYPKASPYSKMRSSSFLSKPEAVLTSSGRVRVSAWSSPGVASRRDQIGEGRAALVNYLTPAFALLYGTFLLGEALTFAATVGLVLIVAGAEVTLREAGARRPGGETRAHPRAHPPFH